MLKRVTVAVILLTLLFSLSGCEEISGLTQGVSTSTSQANLKIVKSEELGSTWLMKQISFKVGAGQKVEILLKLSDGDKVDGFFYLEGAIPWISVSPASRSYIAQLKRIVSLLPQAKPRAIPTLCSSATPPKKMKARSRSPFPWR